MRRPRYMLGQLVRLVALVATPLLLLVVYDLWQGANQARSAAYRAVENYASSVAHDANGVLADTAHYLEFLATRPMVLELDASKCDPLLEGVPRRRRHVANVFISDLSGRAVCFSVRGPGALPETLMTFDWYRGAVASDSVSFSKPFMAPVVRRMVSAMSRPVRDLEGNRTGMVTVLIDLESIQAEWSHYALPPNSRVSIFDADGTVIATRPDFASLVGKDASAVIRQAKSLNPGDVGTAPGIDGIERAFALRPIPAAHWQAGVAITMEAVFGPSESQLKRSLMFAAATVAAVIMLALVTARRMVAPLDSLARTARAIGGGDSSARAPENMPGEFREVAHEFNAMLDADQRHHDFYTALSRTNGAIVRMPGEQSLYEEMCRICVEHGHASLAYISLVDGETMTHVAWAGPAEAFVRQLKVRLGDANMAASGLSGLAAWSGKRQISNDVQSDARTLPWREAGAAVGTRAIAACPFRREGRTVGTLTLHMTVPGFFDERVVALLDEMTVDLSFALDNFARERVLKAAQAQTAKRERQLAGLVDTAMDAIISIDATHCIKLFNRAAAELFQVESASVIGTGLDRFIPMRLREGHRSLVEQFSRTGGTLRRLGGLHNLVAVRADGTEFPIEASISKLGEGSDILMTVVIRDATGLLEAQQAQLAQVAAESASRAKTDFLSRMSHELRTPLNAVLGYAQLLQTDARDPLSAPQHAHVERIRVAGWHLLSLINDVLDVSKIEGGHVSVDEGSVDLVDALDEAIRINQPGAMTAGVKMHGNHRAGGPLLVHADPRRLRQVVINLLSNAIKYNRPGGTVDIQASANGSTTHFDIVDTGLGMDPQQLAQLYEPFNRLGRERGDIEGTGLGLTLSRQLVRLMGGSIEVESAVGVGTTVRVTLRASDAAAPSGLVPFDRVLAPDLREDTAQPAGVVLYIEDNAVNFILVEHLLARWSDVTLLHAETGAEGLAIARRTRIDLILLDMRLPDMDGLDVLRALRCDARTAAFRTVALSASAMPEDVDAAQREGALHYWTKPLDFPVFVREMQRLLLAQAAPARASQVDSGPPRSVDEQRSIEPECG